ncbi:type II toxin-antitoxin system RelE/ParE family toxin [Sedimentitalea sp.]|uniref:type II toxin-antitoxin system RelE/ParE family toxin n=1 Tax=Sedimentitalea sp. TaxID=2048915 RepID=UPI00329A4E02
MNDALFQMFEHLAENRRMARERVEIIPPVPAHPFKSHVVIYRIDGPDILIIRVRHGSEDWMSGLQ